MGCGRDCGVGQDGSRKVGECAEPGLPHGSLLGALCCSERCVPILDTVSSFWTLDTAASRSRGTPSLALKAGANVWCSGCLDPKAQLPVQYPNSPAEAATPPPQGRAEPFEVPGRPASLFPVCAGPRPLSDHCPGHLVGAGLSYPARVNDVSPPNCGAEGLFLFSSQRPSLGPSSNSLHTPQHRGSG